VTLALLLDMAWPTLGRIALPMAFNQCYRAQSVPNFSPLACFLVDGNYIPPGSSDPSCAACAGWQWARPTYKEYAERASADRVDLRTWRRRFVADNEFTGRYKQSKWEHWYV
jgi:hypothetical protein